MYPGHILAFESNHVG